MNSAPRDLGRPVEVDPERLDQRRLCAKPLPESLPRAAARRRPADLGDPVSRGIAMVHGDADRLHRLRPERRLDPQGSASPPAPGTARPGPTRTPSGTENSPAQLQSQRPLRGVLHVQVGAAGRREITLLPCCAARPSAPRPPRRAASTATRVRRATVARRHLVPADRLLAVLSATNVGTRLDEARGTPPASCSLASSPPMWRYGPGVSARDLPHHVVDEQIRQVQVHQTS